MATDAPEPPSPETTIHKASRTFDGSGWVEYGEELTESEAADERRRGNDIVVRGNDLAKTRALARRIEAMVGTPSRPQFPHSSAGRHALPHFHQHSRSPEGHCFYETPKRKARRLS
jgi:hypothetical protein